MADLTKQQPTPAGTTPAYVSAAAGGDKIPNSSDRTMLIVKNTGGSPVTVGIATPRVDPVTKLAEADAGGSVPATTGERWYGPLSPTVYGDPADAGKVAITYSAVTGVTVAAVEVA